jgi:phosphatidylserine/phosphatidylglycerophosphate/cardiolipin synthase-like enzyme
MAVQATLSERVLFAPFDDTTAAFLDFVGSAQKSIEINIYGFHLPKLTDILLAKHAAGVAVSIILDHSQEAGRAEGGEVARLVAAGVPLLIGTSPVHHQILHSKFTVVDGAQVEYGSWNYSLSASQQSNDMHFTEADGIAREYQRHHDRIRSWILLHEMAMQPQGETPAAASLSVVADPEDESGAGVDGEDADPKAGAEQEAA